MNGKTMEERVTDLEKLARILGPLPGEVAGLNVRMGAVEGRLTTVESQIVQLRTDMNGGFSAIRGEMAGMKDELRGEMAGMKDELRGEMAGMKTALRGEMATMKDELREDIAALGRETAAHVLGLHRGLDDIRGEIQRSTRRVLDKLDER